MKNINIILRVTIWIFGTFILIVTMFTDTITQLDKIENHAYTIIGMLLLIIATVFDKGSK